MFIFQPLSMQCIKECNFTIHFFLKGEIQRTIPFCSFSECLRKQGGVKSDARKLIQNPTTWAVTAASSMCISGKLDSGIRAGGQTQAPWYVNGVYWWFLTMGQTLPGITSFSVMCWCQELLSSFSLAIWSIW